MLRCFYIQEVQKAENAQRLWCLTPPRFGRDPKTSPWTVAGEVMQGEKVEFTPVGGAYKSTFFCEGGDSVTWCRSVTGKTYSYRPPID